MYSGQIHGTGPRYCPSIEDKLVRFADKERHQLFIEPVGETTDEMYIQGFSTSLPVDVQIDMLHTLKGFENAEIMHTPDLEKEVLIGASKSGMIDMYGWLIPAVDGFNLELNVSIVSLMGELVKSALNLRTTCKGWFEKVNELGYFES